ncbi:MAG: hypothetical protein EBS70_05055 [Actinobacteria bacterium]|jgi:hypothetical protein|nr:hypothetical protein [Actinomycetota bacterium]
MISKDQSIVMQVAAKIASELTNTTAIPERNVAEVQAVFLQHFDVVNEALQQANGTLNLQESFPTATMETTTEPTAKPDRIVVTSAPRGNGGTVLVAGKQHGDLPNWLIAACQKSGVSKVWDNRDTAVGTRRPWFKQADTVDGQEPVAFWPPKGMN